MSPSHLAALYDAHAQALFAFLLDLTGQEAETRDLLQEVFVRLAQRPGLLDGVASVRGFLIQLARNLAIDSLRRRGARERKHEAYGAELMAEAPESSHAHDDEELEGALRQALQKLPEDQRAIVHLKLWGGLTFAEIAAGLAISPNTAASRYRYGLDKLRELLRPLFNEIR